MTGRKVDDDDDDGGSFGPSPLDSDATDSIFRDLDAGSASLDTLSLLLRVF